MNTFEGIPIVDTMIGFKDAKSSHYVPPSVREGDQGDDHVADYMFKDVPVAAEDDDAIQRTIDAMDANGVTRGLVTLLGSKALTAAEAHPERFLLCSDVDPNNVMAAVQKIRDEHERYQTKAVSFFPSGCSPHVPIDDAKTYPIYATCVELNLPVFINAGVPGPRVTGDAQYVGRFDTVCYDFPDLKVVLRHGAEPDEKLAVKLMLKWPNLFYSTSAFAPKHYPKAIIEYANTRGVHKIMYGGYFPFGLELDRIMDEMKDVPFRDHVWEPFLSSNATTVLGL